MLRMSNLRLHKIASNCPTVMQAFPAPEYTKNLKELDPDSDSLPKQWSLATNWELHKDIHLPGLQHWKYSLFNLLGLVASISIQGKFLLGELTQDTTDWDEPLKQIRKDSGSLGKTN